MRETGLSRKSFFIKFPVKMSPFDFPFGSGRFPRAAGEPPRATHRSGVSPRPLLLLESPLPSLQSNFSQLTRFDFSDRPVLS